MQPYLFPYIGYFQLINSVDRFVLLDDVNFINKGWINRNYLLNGNKPMLFTFPLKSRSQNKLIKDLEFSELEKTKDKFLLTLRHHYLKAPFFKDTFELVSDILSFGNNGLSEFLFNSIKKICFCLEIRTELIRASANYPKQDSKGIERILEICKSEKTDVYVNPPGGVKLYGKEIFESNGIELKFLFPGKIKYIQFENEFTENLSVIDVLMFNSKEKICEMLDDCILK